MVVLTWHKRISNMIAWIKREEKRRQFDASNQETHIEFDNKSFFDTGTEYK